MLKRSFLCLLVLSNLLVSGCLIKGRVVDRNGVGVPGVTITLGGDASMTTTTNSNGDYQFGTLNSLLAPGSYVVTPSGDFTPSSTNVTIENVALDNGDLVPWPVLGTNFTDNTNVFLSGGTWYLRECYRYLLNLPLMPLCPNGWRWWYTEDEPIPFELKYLENGTRIYSKLKYQAFNSSDEIAWNRSADEITENTWSSAGEALPEESPYGWRQILENDYCISMLDEEEWESFRIDTNELTADITRLPPEAVPGATSPVYIVSGTGTLQGTYIKRC